MNADLAFCLGQFIDEQVQLIDDKIGQIKNEESEAYRKIQEEKNTFIRNKPPERSKGSHREDKELVDNFIQDLRGENTAANTRRTIIDDQVCIDTLHAEVSTKINACANYLNRIHNLARPLPNTSKFVATCNEAMTRFRRSQEIETNFNDLCNVLLQSDANNVVQNTKQWWQEKYGSTIGELNRRNKKINPAITEDNFAVLSQTSRIIDNAKKLIAARKIEEIQPTKPEMVRRFVKGLVALDEEIREKTEPEQLIEQLVNDDVEQDIAYAQRWLGKRDEIRNRKEEDPFAGRFDSLKADYGRRRMAQAAKKLALAALLCRLAVGSTNGEQFDRQLKKTIDKQRKDDQENLPIISGDIKDPETQQLPIIARFGVDKTDVKQWTLNTDGIQQQFASGLCVAFCIPDTSINIDNIDVDESLLNLLVKPPYGKNVVDSLNGTAPDAAKRMQAIRKCCAKFKLDIKSITLGDFSLKIDDKLMDPRWNKKYIWPNSNVKDGEFWIKPIDRGGKPYYCPSGWYRFGIKVSENEAEFDSRWGNWFIAYHGTRGENASKILTSGLRVSTQGCFYGDGVPRVYVSPSIEYCAHPRYAFPWRKAESNGRVCWYQLAFQCRVNPASVNKVRQETLLLNDYKEKVKIDTNFDNNELEWIILGKDDNQYIKDDIICYGLMMRVSSVDPMTLAPSAWWKHALHSDCYKKKQ